MAALASRLSAIEGLQAALTPAERHETLLRAVTSEALASFAIEGAALPADQIAASVVASLAHRHSEPRRQTDAIADLMLEAREGQGPLTEERLFHWHRLLFHGIEIESKGAWRSFPMVIARSAAAGRNDVLYTAPPAAEVPAMMAVFLDALAAALLPENWTV